MLSEMEISYFRVKPYTLHLKGSALLIHYFEMALQKRLVKTRNIYD